MKKVRKGKKPAAVVGHGAATRTDRKPLAAMPTEMALPSISQNSVLDGKPPPVMSIVFPR